MDILNSSSFLTAVWWIAGSLVAGFIFEKIVLVWLKALAKRSKWEGDDIIVKSIDGNIILLFIASGAYLGLANIVDSDSLGLAKQIILTFAVLVGTIFVLRITTGFARHHFEKYSSERGSATIIVNLIKILVFAVMGLFVLKIFNISITPLLTAMGIGGLAIALALQDTLSNLFSGIQILMARKIKPGDYIELEDGNDGYVTDVDWRNVTIRTIRNNTVIVPNSKISTTAITNYSVPEKEMSVLIEAGVAYDSDLNKVERVTVEVAKKVIGEITGGVKDFTPLVRFYEFGDSSINFRVIFRTNEFSSQYILKHEFIKQLHARFNKEKIEIPFPIRTVYLKK